MSVIHLIVLLIYVMSQVTSLRSELHVTRASLVDVQADLERYKDSLTMAENRLERMKWEAALALEARAQALAEELAKSNKTRQESEPKQDGTDGLDAQVCIALTCECCEDRASEADVN